MVETRRADGEGVSTFLIEYDRTGRPDKNLEKLRRYDAFLTWWWRYSMHSGQAGPPFVLFVRQDADARNRFLTAANRELTGHHWHPGTAVERHDYVGRSRILFALDSDMHDRHPEAVRVPLVPPSALVQPSNTDFGTVRLPAKAVVEVAH